MKLSRLFICVVFLLGPFLAGCISPQAKRIKVNYYTLEYDSPEVNTLPKLAVSLGMDRFQISPEYDTDKFVFRKTGFQRNHYNYEKWRANPNDLVTYFLNRDLQRSGVFRGVFPPESLYKTTHRITGTLDAFYEKDGDPWQAVLGITLILLKQDEPDVTKRVLLQKTYINESAHTDKTPQAFARAMSAAMEAVSMDILQDLHRILSKEQKEMEGL